MSESFVIVASKRTPFGRFGGSLASVSATEMGILAGSAVLESSGVEASDLDSVVAANVVQSSQDAIYLPRRVALRLGASIETPCHIVNRLCGSGFEAIVQAIYRLKMEEENCALVIGTESMSQTPYVLRDARFGYRMGHGEVEDFLTTSLYDQEAGLAMAMTAENLAVDYQLSREEVDQYALESQQRAAAAWSNNVFAEEVFSVEVKKGRKSFQFEQDEHIRADTSLESLAKLPPLFKKEGVVTAGNASGIVDGAVALIVARESWAKERNLKVLGRIDSWAAVGCDPKVMGIGPVPAMKKALARYEKQYSQKLSWDDFKWIEVNEAFSAQYLAVEKALELPREKTNAHGGGISIGHPLAATGTRIAGHVLHKMSAGEKAIVSACIGGGQGMALILESMR